MPILRAAIASLSLLVCLATQAAPAFAEKRVALVVANSAYAEVGRLANSPNDASAIAAALMRLGFDVMQEAELDNVAFGTAVQDFVAKARGADVALFYYAGHALQLGQTNYLMPIDAQLADELAVKRETIAAQDIVDLMEGAARINLVFLDACRNNPLSERLRRTLAASGRGASVGRGLARLDSKGRDTLIVFSAAPGEEALDMTGASSHSPFAAGLLANMETPGLEIEVMMKLVTRAVRDATGGKQQPERLSRLESVFYFKPSLNALPSVGEDGGDRVDSLFSDPVQAPPPTPSKGGDSIPQTFVLSSAKKLLGGEGEEISRFVTWADTPQGQDFWSQEEKDFKRTGKLSPAARRIVEGWVTQYKPQ